MSEYNDDLADENVNIPSNTLKTFHRKLSSSISSIQTVESTVDIGKIFSMFPSGIVDFFNTKEPEENESYLVLILRKNEQFNKKYESLMNIFGSELNQQDLLNLNCTKSKEDSWGTLNFFQFKTKMINKLNDFYKSNELPIDDILNYYDDIKNKKNEEFYSYEDFIYIFCSLICYQTELKIKIELIKNTNNIALLIYGDIKTYEKMAETFNLELQLKPYAMIYEYFCLYNEKNDINLQFSQLKEFDRTHHPPYFPFEKEKRNKFRTYEIDDSYHFCDKKCEHNVCIFRSVDKLYLIKTSLEYIFKFQDLFNSDILDSIFIKRNNNLYNKLVNKKVFEVMYSFFSYEQFLDLINNIRNYYCEEIAFYFLWIYYLIKSMIFPIIIGIITKVIKNYYSQTLKNQQQEVEGITYNYYDILRFVICFFIIIWADIFSKLWKQKEKIFSYFWGMENLRDKEPLNENFKPDQEINFLFDQKLKTFSDHNYWFRNTVSYSFTFILILIRIFIVHVVLGYTLIQKDPIKILWSSSFSGTLSFICSFIFDYLAKKFTEFENHQKLSNQRNSLAFKLFLFEFFNNYYCLFYFAYIKPYKDLRNYYNEKLNGKNIEFDGEYSQIVKNQLNILLIINLLSSFSNFLVYYGTYLFTKIFYKTKDINYITKQLYCKAYDYDLIIDYNRKIILLGFVCMFPLVATMTPIYVAIVLFIEFVIDYFKITKFAKLGNIRGASGINVYNSIIKFIYYCGILNIGGLIIYTKQCEQKNQYLSNITWESIFTNKYVVFALCGFALFENVILLCFSTVNYNLKPMWFKHLDQYKTIYLRKYYNREDNYLPHLKIKNK